MTDQEQEHYQNRGLTDMIRDFLTHILKDNVFEFNNKYYRQIHGTAMGTKGGLILCLPVHVGSRAELLKIRPERQS